jgi:PAS domain S-box-containing protein
MAFKDRSWAVWRVAQPRGLRLQMLMLLTAVTAVAMGLLMVLSNSRMEESASRSTESWARALAGNVAASALPILQTPNPRGDDAVLKALASLPGVAGLVVRDAAGRDRLVLQQGPDGRVLRVAAPGLAPLDTTDALQVWSPVGPAGSLGSVGVTVSRETERSHIAALRYDGVLAIALTGLAMLMAVYLFLARALAPLNHLVSFAGELAAHAGTRHSVQGGSRELRELGTALNDASAMLRNQLDVLAGEQARTQSIVNAVPDVILGLDGDCQIAIVNPGVSSVFGLPPEEIRGLPLQDFLPGIDQAEAEARTTQGLFMRSTRTHVARFEITARRHDGTEFPAEVSLSRIETEEGARYAAMVRDVTEQRMSMAMLNLYCRALECTSNGVVISDMSLPGSPVFYANPAFYRITGYDPGFAIGRNCDFLQGDDKAQPEIEQLRQAVAEGRSTQAVLRNYRKDGSLFFNELAIAPVAEADGSIKHYVGVLNDVTERERSRMAIAERSARLNNVFDLSPDGFVVFDASGHMAYCNRAFQTMTGWEASDAALTVAEFDQRFALLCSNVGDYEPVKSLVDGEGGVDSAHTLMLALPERRVLARVVRSGGDGQGESILFFRDVTRETEVDRMKSEFLTTAAHELRTPMVSVFGFTELLLRRPVPEARRKDMLETIHRQASLLINMVNELLDLARIEARQGKDLKREVCRLDSLITQAVGPLVVASGLHTFELDIGHGEALLWVDPEKTHRALINVLGNAVKYSPSGGSVHVRTLSGTLRGEAAVGVQIEDQGMGMTAEQVARVFERFYRADPSGNIPGTGLGMSLVKEIVELQGGSIDLHSEIGQGSRVTLWFPQQRQALESPVASTRPAALQGH